MRSITACPWSPRRPPPAVSAGGPTGSDIGTCIVHLGGTALPGGLVVTMDGEEGRRLLQLIRPGRAVPVRYDDYGVFKSPLQDFRDQVCAHGLEDLVTYVERGQTVTLQGAAT